MTEDHESAEEVETQRKFRVIARGESHAIVNCDAPIQLTGYPTSCGGSDIAIYSLFEENPEGGRIASDLIIQIDIVAESLDQAVQAGHWASTSLIPA